MVETCRKCENLDQLDSGIYHCHMLDLEFINPTVIDLQKSCDFFIDREYAEKCYFPEV